MKKRYGHIVRYYGALASVSSILLVLIGAMCFAVEKSIAGISGIAAGIILLICAIVLRVKRKKQITEFLHTVLEENDSVAVNVMASFPIPMVVAHIDGSVRWYNERFSELFANKNLFGTMLEGIVPELRWSTILKDGNNISREIKINKNEYNVKGYMIKDHDAGGSDPEDRYSVYLYFIDKTAEHDIKALYENERTDIAVINIDNYDEVLQRVNDNEQQMIASNIRNLINVWAGESNALVKKTDRDRYFVFFEHRYLAEYIKKKFDVLDKVRAIGEEINQPISISIGIGVGGSLSENDSYARSALDLALGRGGDQVSIKDDTQYKFYGGKNREYEKSTRVKTRAVALALKDFIKNSDKVIFMGHNGADYDCFGAAMGLQRAVRSLNKTPYILYDNNSPAIKALYTELRNNAEYAKLFVDINTAQEILTSDTLVVILDTHRPSMLPCPQLAERAAKVVLIDHHRRATEFLTHCSLMYHEPYASSTCEMATELLEYMDLGGALTTTEAECLYTGILMDTKNFILKTGVRTFDAASYLRRLGLNTIAVKKLFNIEKADYDHKVDIVKTAVEIAPDIAVARCYEKFHNIKVIASQAADEMLNINNIRASIVVYPLDGCACISARSMGDINVQVIMETLGGGGHMTVAGAQLKDTSIDMAVEKVKKAVESYIEEK
ncbi:MAG: DHH family phosphoesterase [Clostridia bacterium]|nr:DHH family phosphoesterase [Clostridia bacterium]